MIETSQIKRKTQALL